MPDDIDDELAGVIEEKHDELMEINRQIPESQDQHGPGNYSIVGIMLYLEDGQVSYADVNSDL